MKGCIILNPSASSADQFPEFYEAIESSDLEMVRTYAAGEAESIARERALDYDLIIAAGGDGTLSEVVNGLWAGSNGSPVTETALIPLGTGNDFARTLCLPDDPVAALELAMLGARHHLDLIELRFGGDSRIAVNACVGGFAGALDEQISPEVKKVFGPLSYLIGAASRLPEVEPYDLHIEWPDGQKQQVRALNMVVANGRTAGGGAPAAPRASPEDGLLDVVIIRAAPVTELSRLASKALRGEYLDDENILFRQVESLHVAATPEMTFNADGEPLYNTPLSFQIIPSAISMVTGPRYSQWLKSRNDSDSQK